MVLTYLTSENPAYSNPGLVVPTFTAWHRREMSAGVLTAIKPSYTDPHILDKSRHGVNKGFGAHVVGLPKVSNGRTWVHFTGTGGRAYLERPHRFLNANWDNELMTQGYTVLDMAYDNEVSVTQSCSTPYCRNLDNCAGDIREEVLNAGGTSPLRAVTPFDSVRYRVLALVNYLYDNGFPIPPGLLPWDWNNVWVSGHSQGGCFAYYIAKLYGVKFCACFGSPYDVADVIPVPPSPSDPTTNIADWYQLPIQMTPTPSNIGGLVTVGEDAYDAFTGCYAIILHMTKGVHWFECNDPPYHDENGKVIDEHAASIQDPKNAPLRAAAAFRLG